MCIFLCFNKVDFLVISREIRPLAALYHLKVLYRAAVVAGGGMIMPTSFAPLSIVRGLISRDIADFFFYKSTL